MCGCMLMHALMDHDEHQHSSRSAPVVIPAANTTKCGHCGVEVQQDFSFCPNCGIRMKQANCAACGQKVEPTWNTCAHCGSPLGTGLASPANA
jgi:predicted amidophosphoribosyltransferase